MAAKQLQISLDQRQKARVHGNGGDAVPANPHICSFYQETQYLFWKPSSRLVFMTQSSDLGHMATSKCKGIGKVKTRLSDSVVKGAKRPEVTFM